MEKTLLAWPPAYRIREHARAKSVKLRAKTSGLEITVPPRFNLNYLPAVLEEHKAWIMQHVTPGMVSNVPLLPTEITLRAFKQTWQVRYVKTQMTTLKLIENANHELVLIGNIEHAVRCQKLLTAWVKKYAAVFLEKKLNELSQLTALPFRTLSIRNQKTVWGSCSLLKNINLNYKLIFLPESLMQYVLIHEICHIKQLNHSKKFWLLVERYDADWKVNRKLLRDANQFIPDWLWR